MDGQDETCLPLQFQPWFSSVDPSFWHAFAERKLNVEQLNDAPIVISASYVSGTVSELPPRLCISSSDLVRGRYVIYI